MRKHFLILMLLTLLPLATWAADYGGQIKITPANASKYYGDADPVNAGAVKTAWFAYDVLPDGVSVTAIANALMFKRVEGQSGEDVGTYSYTFEDEATVNNSGDTKYYDLIIMGTGTFSIKAKPLGINDPEGTFKGGFNDFDDNATINIITPTFNNEQYKNGTTTVKPKIGDVKITVKLFNGITRDLDANDFSIKADGYGNNNTTDENASYYTIEGKGNYTGTRRIYFTLKGTNIATKTVTYNGPSLTYKGSAYTTDNFANNQFTIAGLEPGVNLQIKAGSVVNGLNASTTGLSITLQGTGDYSGEKVVNIPIAKKTGAFAFELGASPQYTGSAEKPNFTTLTVGGVNVNATDYELTGLGTTPGQYTATLKFKATGNFSGADQNIAYTIAKRTFNGGNVTVEFNKKNNTEITNYTYENAPITPAYKVYFQPGAASTKTELTLGTDFEVTYEGATAGTKTDLTNVEDGKKLIVKGKGYFTNTSETAITKTYNVKKRTVTVSAQNMTVGMGADVVPTLVFDAFATGHTSALIPAAAAPVYTYRALDGEGNETGAVIPQSADDPDVDIKKAGIGKYHIIVNVDAFNTAADAAETALKNYTFVEPAVNKRGTLDKVAGQIVLAAKYVGANAADPKDDFITFGESFTNSKANGQWVLEYVSGLTEATAPAFIAALGVDEANFALVDNTYGADDLLPANATGYDVNYNGGSIHHDNYSITVQPGKLIVKKKLIDVADIAIDDATLKYKGEAVAPTVTVKGIDENGDTYKEVISPKYYSVVYDEVFNAGTRTAKIYCETDNYTTTHDTYYTAAEATAYNDEHATEIAAGELEAVAENDFKETLTYVTKDYFIQQLPLTITVNSLNGEAGWTYGQNEPVYSATAEGQLACDQTAIDELLAGGQPTGFNGKLVITRTCANTVGEHVNALEAAIVDENDAPIATPADRSVNYAINFVAGNLTINKGELVVRVKSKNVPYGEPVGDFYLEPVSGMAAAEVANFETIMGTYDHAAAKYGYNTENKAIAEYPLAYTGTLPTPTNYTVKLAEGDAAKGTLNITKRPVKFTAENFNVDYENLNAAYKTTRSTVNATNITQNIGGEFYSLLGEDVGHFENVIASIAPASYNIGANDIVMTAKASDIYEITLVPGTLTISATGVTPLILKRPAKADYDDPLKNTTVADIKAKKDKIVNVTFSDFTLLEEKWYPLVLPFATSVKDISAAFGYAVVDIFNGTDANGNIKFKLHMGDIAANTPFIVKVYKEMNMSVGTCKFNNVAIEDAMDANGQVFVGDASDVQFVGTYKGRIEGFRSNMYYFSTADNEYHKGNDTNKTYLRPLGAYFVDNAPNAANSAREILIEEADGSTTAISAITVDGAFVEADGWYTTGGVKLQGVPTEKGVYIRNGKKIVIK